jgi:hypothetical protein
MPEKRFQEVGLNVATNHREASAEEILLAHPKLVTPLVQKN